MNDERLGGNDLGLAAERGHPRQRHPFEQRVVARELAPRITIRHPPLFVTRVEIVRGDATHFLEFENWYAADRRCGARLERARARVGRGVGLWPRQRAEESAVIWRLAVAMPRARIVLDFDRAQAALAADVEHSGLRIGRSAPVD